jgi:hypothetical protein
MNNKPFLSENIYVSVKLAPGKFKAGTCIAFSIFHACLLLVTGKLCHGIIFYAKQGFSCNLEMSLMSPYKQLVV